MERTNKVPLSISFKAEVLLFLFQVPLDIKPGEFIRLVRTSSLEDSFDVTASSFSDVAVPSADHKTSDNENSSKQRDAFILVGLHTCGDLSSTLLRTFVNCPEVKGMALVGCCYMKLTCDSVEASYDDNCSDHLFIASDDSKERSSCSLDTVERRLFSDGIISVGSNCRNRITCKEFKNCAVANCSYDSCNSGDTGSLNAKLCHVNDIDSLQQISNCSINFGCQLPDSYAEMSNGSDDKCKNPHVKDHCSGGNDWNTNLIGFPMSHFLQIQGRPFIGWDAFELACHNLDNYLLRLRGTFQFQKFSLHNCGIRYFFWRATLGKGNDGLYHAPAMEERRSERLIEDGD